MLYADFEFLFRCPLTAAEALRTLARDLLGATPDDVSGLDDYHPHRLMMCGDVFMRDLQGYESAAECYLAACARELAVRMLPAGPFDPDALDRLDEQLSRDIVATLREVLHGWPRQDVERAGWSDSLKNTTQRQYELLVSLLTGNDAVWLSALHLAAALRHAVPPDMHELYTFHVARDAGRVRLDVTEFDENGRPTWTWTRWLEQPCQVTGRTFALLAAGLDTSYLAEDHGFTMRVGMAGGVT